MTAAITRGFLTRLCTRTITLIPQIYTQSSHYIRFHSLYFLRSIKTLEFIPIWSGCWYSLPLYLPVRLDYVRTLCTLNESIWLMPFVGQSSATKSTDPTSSSTPWLPYPNLLLWMYCGTSGKIFQHLVRLLDQRFEDKWEIQRLKLTFTQEWTGLLNRIVPKTSSQNKET